MVFQHPASIENSPLAKKNAPLADEVKKFLEEAQNLGVKAGVKRVELVCSQFDSITPEIAYYLIDIDGFQQEIEEGQERQAQRTIYKQNRSIAFIQKTTDFFVSFFIRILPYLRHIASLIPLVLTWLSLLVAANAYQQYYQQHLQDSPNTPRPSFLLLWQQGFPGVTISWPFSIFRVFADVAFLDVVFLLTYLSLILLSHRIDNHMHRRVVDFIKRFQITVDKLVLAITHNQLNPINNPSDLNKITLAIKQVIDDALTASQQITQQAQRSISETHQHTEDILTNRVTPLLQAHEDTAKTLQQNLSGLQTTLRELLTQSDLFAQHTTELTNKVQLIATTNQELHQSIGTLNQNEQDILTQMQQLLIETQSSNQKLTSASDNVELSAIALTEMAQQLEKGQDTLLTRMGSSENYLLQFQQNLQDFNNYLDRFGSSTESIMNTARNLGDHIQHYSTIGQEVHDQINLLRVSEEAMRDQLAHIQTSIQTTASDMGNVVQHIETVPQEMHSANDHSKAQLDALTDQFKQISQMFAGTATHLDKITSTMYHVTRRLNSLPLSLSPIPSDNGNTHGGFPTPPLTDSSPIANNSMQSQTNQQQKLGGALGKIVKERRRS